ncbi:TPA: GNAT family N-acetyltransferase [Vibrio parahaemolyticus]|nr:GNAT family N-acetyltransferase [Vibrio parahaemolyticus]HCG8295668.1 GNAT family N-acetyltransferase [Vibrio parahaemolyticus]HCG8300891.1 GNAT family N-acetyltransferase [Vibrio parahaemolyticus]HCG8311031.1 GNAT family N-acetyltransferase [Vibrio parahaemolyticus]HCH0866881.1 GNAT family N-acetyltransferase [Vibrio parahaemolyticus]
MNYESGIFRVRELRETDASSLFNMYSGSSSSAKYISTLPHDTVETKLSKIKQWRKFYSENAPKVCVYGVAASPDDFVFGLVVFVFNEQYAEIHFGISDQFSNRGIAAELCRSGLQYLKSLGVNEVRTNPFIEHIVSIRVLEKSGFSNNGTLKNHARFPTLGDGLFNCADMRISL